MPLHERANSLASDVTTIVAMSVAVISFFVDTVEMVRLDELESLSDF